MNFQFLKYFVWTYELQSITKAALKGGLSNTAISKGIKSLEDSLDISLIKHKKNQLIFTKDAERIYKSALEILDKVNDISDKKEISHKSTKIGVLHSLATGRLSSCISDLAKDIKTQILIANPTEVKNLLSRYLIDFAVTIKREKGLDTNEFALHSGAFKLYESTEIKKPRSVIFMTPDWPEVEQFKKDSDLLLKSKYKVCIIDSWDVIYSAVKKGEGYGLLPDYFKIENKKIKKASISKFSYDYQVIIKHQNSYYEEDIFKQFKRRF